MKYLQYWPIIAAILLFFCGRWTAPDNSKELTAKFEQERAADRQAISGLLEQQALKDAESAANRENWGKDTVRILKVVKGLERANKLLKQENVKINLKGTDNADLDSIDLIIFGAR